MPMPSGFGGMRPAKVPQGQVDPVMQIVPPIVDQIHAAKESIAAAEAETILAQSEETKDELVELVEGFRAEIDLSRQHFADKKRKVHKGLCYLSGRDVDDPPEDYNESTFFYRRLPRVASVGKTKILKHICPLEGRPFHLDPSAISEEDPKVQDQNLRNLRSAIDDVHQAIELDNVCDDMATRMTTHGSEVFYGPITISQPRLQWQSGTAVIQPSDAKKPMWLQYDMLDVFPDPRGKSVEKMEFIHFRHLYSTHQLRSLSRDASFNKAMIAKVLEENPEGTWLQETEEWEDVPARADFFIVWMRSGFLDAETLELLKARNLVAIPKGEDDRILLDSLWEIWFCGDRIIKAARRNFHPEKIPAYFVPFFRDVNSPFGVGPIEALLDIQDMLLFLTRAIDDDLMDTSGYQAVVDAGAVQNTDMTPKGRKTWLARRKSNEKGDHSPVTFFVPPSKLEALVSAMQYFESLIPVVSGIPEMTTGLDMGSGVRTNMMHNDVWNALEDFLKDVIGNVDRFFWKPFLRDTYDWLTAYAPNKAELAVDPMIVVTGVKGALKREIVGRKVQEFYLALKQNGDSLWADEIEVMKAITEGLGLDATKTVLTPDKYVERVNMEMQRLSLKVQAEGAPEMKERAHMSARDVMLQGFKSTSPNNPLWLDFAEQLFETTGLASPRVYAALAVWRNTLVAYYQRLGLATPEQAAILSQPFKNESPLELEPGVRNEAEAQQADALKGKFPVAGPDPTPALPMPDQSELATLVNGRGLPGGGGSVPSPLDVQPGDGGMV